MNVPLVDLAIEKFKEYQKNQMKNEEYEIVQDFKFPHWVDIIEKIETLWTSKYEGHLLLYNEKNEIENLIQKFKIELVRIISKKTDFVSFKKYYEYIIDYEINLIKTHIEEFEISQKENKNISENQPLKMNIFKSIKKATIKLHKINQEHILKYSNINLSHMIRGHSKNNDPNDNLTEVKDAAFELAYLNNSLDEQPSYTNVCATCGGNIVNLIDVTSKKIIKRFNDEQYLNGSQESYNCLSWTKIKNTSVLAAAGKHGQIKIILPKYSACLARIDAHNGQINQLVFHHKYPNILFSTSDDQNIKVWQINLKESDNELECECHTELISIISYRTPNVKKTKEKVLSTCFIPDDYFIFSTDINKYYIQLTDSKLFERNKMANSDDDDGTEDIFNYLTTAKIKSTMHSNLQANVLSSWGRSEANLELYEDSYVCNKIYYWKNLIVANVVDTNKVCYSKVIHQEKKLKENGIELRLETIKYVDKGEETNESESKPTFFKETKLDNDTLFVFQPSSNAIFEYIVFDLNRLAKIACLRASIPSEYMIGNRKDMSKIPINDYSLLEKTRVLACVFNGTYIVVTTNKNIILIWQNDEKKLIEKTQLEEMKI